MKKIIYAVVLMPLMALVLTGCTDTTEKTVFEKCTGTYNLDASWCEIMEEYIPEFELLSNIEQGGTHQYKVSLSNNDEYYVIITRDNEVMKITTAEEDYNSRTTLYEK